jgi:hypothetical protein
MIPAWIGWLAVAVIATAFAAAFVAQRRRKANKKPSHYVVLVDNFPVTHVPRKAVESMEDAREVVVGFRGVYRASWAVFGGIYNESTRAAPIDTIGMSLGAVHPTHPNVVWFAPTSKMRLRFQDSMHYHFAGELHNMFRFNLYGIEYIHLSKDKMDRACAIKTRAWIDEHYGGETWE